MYSRLHFGAVFATLLVLLALVLADSCQDPVWAPLNLSDPILVEALDSVRELLVGRASSVPSFSLSIMYGDEQLFTLSMGSNLTAPYRIDSHTVYRIGSVTKVFTTLLAFQSLDRHLDSPMTSLIPELKALPKCFDRMRLRNVMSHLAGLPRESPCPLFGCNISNTDAISYLKSLCEQGLFIAPPDSLPSYSNFGFSILGRLILERTLKASWEDLVKKMIVNPLGMPDTAPTWWYLSTAAQARAVPGFVGTTPVPLPGAQLLWDSPAGEMWSSSSDLVHLQSVLLKLGYYNMATPEGAANLLNLNPASVRLWLNEMEYLNSDGTGWGLPWEVAQKFSSAGNWRILGKGGAVPGYLAHIAAIPRIRLSFALLVNGAASMEGWRDDVFNILVPALYKLLSQGDTYSAEAPLPLNPSRYVGTYVYPANPLGVSATIQLVPMPTGSFLVAGIKFGTSYSLLLRSSGPNPAHLQVGSTFKGLSCMNSEMTAFENQFAIFTFANQSDPTSPALTLSFPGVVYDVTLDRISDASD